MSPTQLKALVQEPLPSFQVQVQEATPSLKLQLQELLSDFQVQEHYPANKSSYSSPSAADRYRYRYRRAPTQLSGTGAYPVYRYRYGRSPPTQPTGVLLSLQGQLQELHCSCGGTGGKGVTGIERNVENDVEMCWEIEGDDRRGEE
jgi:hypothetical protein